MTENLIIIALLLGLASGIGAYIILPKSHRTGGRPRPTKIPAPPPPKGTIAQPVPIEIVRALQAAYGSEAREKGKTPTL